MRGKLRIGFTQIQCSADHKQNLQQLIKCVDWAYENQVDLIVTPETSLSGYYPEFHSQGLVDSLQLLENHARDKSIAVCLGTLWKESDGSVRNQIRSYNKLGQLVSTHNKILLTKLDLDCGVTQGTSLNLIPIEAEDHEGNICNIIAAGLICADLYGAEGCVNLPKLAQDNGAKILLHSTNANRNVDETHDKVTRDWNTAHLQMISWLSKMPIVTVDNSACPNGELWDGPTSSPSGVLINGEWAITVPDTGNHMQYWDFDVDNYKDINYTSNSKI